MNTKFAAVMTGLTMAVSLFSTGGAAAYTNHGKVMTFDLVTQTAAITPLSMQFFCAKNRSECAGGGNSQVTMTPNLMAVLKQINGHVNRKGLPASALRIAYTHTRRGEPHAVLVVKTSQGDYVLDNLTNSIKTLRASGYNIRSMSSPNPTRWTAG